MDKIKLKLELLNHDFIDNEYLDKYLDVILSEDKEGTLWQVRHIIPRSWYKINNLEINNSPDNLVKLSIHNHILSHYYMSLCTDGKLRYCQQFAFLHMTSEKLLPQEKDLILNLPLYEQIYSQYIEQHSRTVSEVLINRYKNETAEQKEARIKKLKDARIGTSYRWYTNGIDSKFLVEGTQPDGYYLGQSEELKRKNSHVAWNKGLYGHVTYTQETQDKKSKSMKQFYIDHPETKEKRVIRLPWYTDGIHNKKLSPEQVDEYLSNGWRRGMAQRKKLTEKTP